MKNNKPFKTPTEIRHIATSTDANYLHKAIVLYRSLLKVHDNFLLHMFCFDDIAYSVFKRLNYQNLKIYHPSDFENKELLKVKASKVKRYEYYWACNPFITRKVLLDQDTDFVSSCDCDLMFFDSPEVIFSELGNADVLIQPNNFSYQFVNDFTLVGYYCTSFQCFKKNQNSIKILNWWHKKTIKWCSSKFEDGKFGEQKYLDDWRIRFKKVREIANVGTNVAPWNIQKYDISKRNKQIIINAKYPLIYYHYHSFRMDLKNYQYIITGDRHNNYPISEKVIKLVYKPYIKVLKETIKELKKIKDYREYVQTNPRGIQIPFGHKK
jgi:hypothetical protein